jgi:carbamoylphosphate synthase large subunit
VPQRLHTPAHYPIVAKTQFGDNSEGVWIVHDADELAALRDRHEPEPVVLTEYIPGTCEYAFHFLAKQGKVLWSGLVEHDHSESGDWPYIRGQNGANGISRTCGEIPRSSVLYAIVDALDFTGTGCFDFKVVDGTVKLFELNPRPGYSLAFWLNPYLNALVSHVR